jgi:hypothetical protein
MITLDDNSFTYYALTNPHPYSLVIFMTAAHPKFKCSVCKQIDSEMSLVASNYLNTMKGKENNEKTSSNEVFFIRLDYENAPKTFSMYDINSVPVVYHIPPSYSIDSASISSSSSSGSAPDKSAYVIPAKDRFQISANPDAESIAGFVRDHTGVSVAIKRSMFWSYITLLILFGIMAALVRPIINSLPFWLSLIRQKFIWILISSGIYTCAISGLIFDIIRSPQM